jgi:hypothetical protein
MEGRQYEDRSEDRHHPDQPLEVTGPVTAVRPELAFPHRDTAMRHMRFTGMPANKARECGSYYRYSHGGPVDLWFGATVIKNVIGAMV